MIRGQVLLHSTPLAGKPTINVENACASSSTAFHLAASAVAAGQVDAAIAIGIEDMSHPDRLRTFGALAAATDTVRRREMYLLVESLALRADAGVQDAPSSPLMDHGRRHRPRSTSSDSETPPRPGPGRCEEPRELRPEWRRQIRRRLSVEDVLADKMIATPLTRSMCAPISNGGAAIVVASKALRQRIGAVPVQVLGLGMASRDPRSSAMPSQAAAEQAFATAGVGPERDRRSRTARRRGRSRTGPDGGRLADCGPGQSLELVRAGATCRDGKLPVNPSGGLLSRGHPLGATGCAQLVELAEQIRGRCGERQINAPQTVFGTEQRRSARRQ